LVNRARVGLAQALVATGEVEPARALSTAIVAWSAAHGDRRSEHFGHHFLADCALIEGRCDQALPLYQVSLRLARALGDRVETGFELQGVAMALAGLGEDGEALRLAAAVDAERERLGAHGSMNFWDALLERYVGAARRRTEADDLERAEAEGRALPFDEAVERALGAAAPRR
jgi:hypothetical protein